MCQLKKKWLVSVVTLLVCWSPDLPAAGPAENATLRHELVIRHLKEEAAKVTVDALAGIKRLEDWEAVREEKRAEYFYMLGLDPLRERTPLEARVTGILRGPGYRVEKVVFQSSPKLYVTGNFYVPDDIDGPLPTILYVCGHSPHPSGAKFQYQDRAQWFVENGYACLIIDTLEFGEVAGIHHGLHNLNMWRWLSSGYTPAGVEVWNAMRAIDWLETRNEVDSTRIGITGISGGGAVSWYAAAADERIAVAAPVCGTFTFGSQADHWIADGQCDCIYFNNTFQSDLSVVGALIAPRPLMLCSGARDPIFPADGYNEIHRQTKHVYDFYLGNNLGEERIQNVDDDVPHQDSPKLRQAVRQWFNQWLKNDMSPVEQVANPTTKRHAAEELACLESVPWDAANFSVHDRFVSRAAIPDMETLTQWEQRREKLVSELRDKTFRWFPTNEIPFQPSPNGGYGGWMERYGGYSDRQIQTETGTYVRVQLIEARERTSDTPLVIYVKRPTDNLSFVDVDELLPLLGHCDVMMVNPRLTDRQIDHQEFTNMERTAVWSGRTVAAMQVWDILRVVEWSKINIQGRRGKTVVFAKDAMSVPALYATVMDKDIDQLIVRNLPSSHENAPPLLNVLRFTDISEIAGAVAPRRLTVLGSNAAQFIRTGTIYELHESPGAYSVAESLAEAVFLNGH